MIVLALLLLALAGWLLWQSRRTRQSAGLPGGRVIYSDARSWGPVEAPLVSARLGLSGKPDYLVQPNPRLIIPVEVKTGRTPAAPHDAHIFQLAAYCCLVEETTGQRPPYGILHYPERTYAIDYTPELEQALLDLLGEMRACVTREPDRSHQAPGRCAGCGYRRSCDQRL